MKLTKIMEVEASDITVNEFIRIDVSDYPNDFRIFLAADPTNVPSETYCFA